MEPEKKLETIKKDIRSLLISSPIGLRVQDLLDDYRAMLGKHLPFQELGYNSAMEMIKHMPDVVVPVFHAGGVMYLKAVADSSTKHIKKLVEQQRKTGRISRIRKPAEEALRRPPPGSFVPSTIRVKLKELMKSYPEGLSTDMLATAYLRRFGRELRCETFGFPTFKKFLEACSDLVDIVENNQDGKKSSTIYAKNHTTSPQNIVKNALFNKLKSDLTTKAKQTIPNGPPKQANLPTTQEKVPVSRSNSLTSPRKTNSLTSPRRTSTSRIPPTEKKVKSLMDLEDNFSQSPKPTAVKDPVIKIKSGVSDEVKKELSSLLAGKPNGMWLARLPFEYKRQFSKDLDIKGAGYFNLIEMIGSLPDMITMQRPVKNGDWLLTGLQKVSQAVREDPIPNDAVTAHGIFKKVSYPTEGQMQIFIVHISDPGSFCFHYCEKKEAHDQLMQNIQSFYNSVASQKYLLPSKLTKPGQVCCAIYEEDGEWYRAEIAKVISDREIEVFYVDYGNLSRVAPSKLRILRKDFIELPAMGIRGRLANILPKASFDWSAEAGKRFFELANNRILLGNICGNDKGAVLLHLIDANKKQQVHINDVLVVEGFAIYKDPIPTAAPALNPATRLPNNVFLNQQKPHLDVNIPSQGLATYDSTMASALIPYLFQQMQQGQQFINGQPRPFTQEDLARALSSMMVGNNKMPQTQNTVTTSQLDKEPMVSVNSQQSAPAPEEQSSLASFINAVNSEVDVQNTSDDSSDVFEAESEDSMACFVNIRRLLIPEAYTVHAINIEGKPYVTSGEIAALFWHGDILRAMLRREKAAIEKVVISRDENGELFNELIKYDVGGVQDANGVKDYMTVYQLESLPTILDIFKHKSEELKKMVKVEVNQYKINPESYWLAEQTDDSSDDIEEDSQSLELELEELRLLLQAMQFRRKRLMNALVNKKSSASAVDELRQVEEEVERIRKKVQIKEGITK